MVQQLLMTDTFERNGNMIVSEFYLLDEDEDFLNHRDRKQVNAVTYTPDGQIVISETKKGAFTTPGGKIEWGETRYEGLAREILEETNCKILKARPFGYEKTFEPDGSTSYNLRCVALVEVLEGPVDDPAGTMIARKIVAPEEVSRYITRGEKIEVYLEQAARVREEM